MGVSPKRSLVRGGAGGVALSSISEEKETKLQEKTHFLDLLLNTAITFSSRKSTLGLQRPVTKSRERSVPFAALVPLRPQLPAGGRVLAATPWLLLSAGGRTHRPSPSPRPVARTLLHGFAKFWSWYVTHPPSLCIQSYVTSPGSRKTPQKIAFLRISTNSSMIHFKNILTIVSHTFRKDSSQGLQEGIPALHRLSPGWAPSSCRSALTVALGTGARDGGRAGGRAHRRSAFKRPIRRGGGKTKGQ